VFETTDRVDAGETLDPGVRTFVAAARGSLFPPLDDLPAARLRATVNAALLSHDRVGYVAEPVARVEVASYADVPARVYFPSDAPRAVVVYLHGGGFVAGSLDTHDKTTRRLTNAVGVITVSVDYSLAPERPAPHPVDDAFAATREASRRYPFLPLIVMGDSAGGSLAGSVAQRAFDEGLALAGQVLIYPVTEFDLDAASMRAFGTDYLLTRADLARYRHDYQGQAATMPRYALPATREDLRGLAPAIVTVSGFDPLRDEGERYARRLSDAGVVVQLVEHPGLIHGWLEIVDVVEEAAAARDRLLADVSRLVRRVTPPTHNSKEQ
jgi:acetyl esterase